MEETPLKPVFDVVPPRHPQVVLLREEALSPSVMARVREVPYPLVLESRQPVLGHQVEDVVQVRVECPVWPEVDVERDKGTVGVEVPPLGQVPVMNSVCPSTGIEECLRGEGRLEDAPLFGVTNQSSLFFDLLHQERLLPVRSGVPECDEDLQVQPVPVQPGLSEDLSPLDGMCQNRVSRKSADRPHLPFPG